MTVEKATRDSISESISADDGVERVFRRVQVVAKASALRDVAPRLYPDDFLQTVQHNHGGPPGRLESGQRNAFLTWGKCVGEVGKRKPS